MRVTPISISIEDNPQNALIDIKQRPRILELDWVCIAKNMANVPLAN